MKRILVVALLIGMCGFATDAKACFGCRGRRFFRASVRVRVRTRFSAVSVGVGVGVGGFGGYGFGGGYGYGYGGGYGYPMPMYGGYGYGPVGSHGVMVSAVGFGGGRPCAPCSGGGGFIYRSYASTPCISPGFVGRPCYGGYFGGARPMPYGARPMMGPQAMPFGARPMGGAQPMPMGMPR